MLTLEDVKVGKATKVDQQIVETFQRSSALLNAMEFDNSVSTGNGSTLSYGYVQLKTPSTAGVRRINEEYTPSEAKKEEKTINLAIIGGSYEIDRVLDEAQPDEVAFQAEEKIKATVNEFHNLVVNGSKTGGDQFDGLNALLTGADTEFQSEANLSVTTDSAFKTNAMKVTEEIDGVLAAMADTPDFIMGNSKALIKLQSAARTLGYLTSSEDAFGKKVNGYNNIPFLDLKKYVEVSDETVTAKDIVEIDEDGKTDIYFVKLGRNALTGVTINGDKIIKSRLPDFKEAKAVHKGDVEFVAGIALKNSRMAGVLRGVQVQASI